MSQSAVKLNVLQPSFNHGNRLLNSSSGVATSIDALKSTDSPLQRSTVRKSFKRRLPQQQQNLPVRDAIQQQPSPAVSVVGTRIGTKNSLGPDPPASVARRNARERNRVKQVNTGFAVLRQHIPVLCGSVIVYGGSPHCSDSSSSSSSPPSAGTNKKNKMSKVETLRCAVEYIRNLETLLASAGNHPEQPAGSAQQQFDIKEEPLDCLAYDLDGCESRENISPLEIGLSSSGNDLSAFYDSSSSPESQSPDVHHGSADQRFLFPFLDTSGASPTASSNEKRIKTEPESSALFKQELLRSLSSWKPEQPLTDLLLDQAGSGADHHQQQNISDHSLLESINSWWGAAL